MSALLRHVGPIGLAALAVVLATVIFQATALNPLESELRLLATAAHRIQDPSAHIRASTPAVQMAAFYRFFDQPVAAYERLAQIYGIARAVGVEMPSADYQVLPTGTRLVRYQIKLPIIATYGQARAFMANALNDIPILSLDQANFRRVRANDPRLEVDIVMTLHLLEP
ncbi:MAG: hypothetical protein ACRENK_08320 [Gemmatimonadaceae bacterium]